ncbi:hypothetical protein P7C70_g3596, partial [Phenoliferia sp. Uapishka_3]
MLPPLPEEILSVIIEHLADSLSVDNLPDSDVRREDPYYKPHDTGRNVSLASLRFLPYGRRLLYSHFNSHNADRIRDDDEDPYMQGTFLRRLHNLDDNPHLALFVKEFTVGLENPPFREEQATMLGRVLKLCTRLTTFSLLEGKMRVWDDDTVDDLEWERNSRERCRLSVLKCLSDPSTFDATQLRYFTLRAGTGHSKLVENLLRRSPNLESLDIRESEILSRNPSVPLYFPLLQKLTASGNSHQFVVNILAASPNLRHFTWHTDRSYDLPTLQIQYPSVDELQISRIHSRETPYETADDLKTLAPFISSFPQISTLVLVLESTPLANTTVAIAPPTAASHLFFSSLPSTITTLRTNGRPLVPVNMDLASALCTVLPALRSLEASWESRRVPPSWENLAKACSSRNIEMHGTIRSLADAAAGARDCEELMKTMEWQRSEVLELRATLDFETDRTTLDFQLDKFDLQLERLRGMQRSWLRFFTQTDVD